MKEQTTYLNKITEALERLSVCEQYISEYQRAGSVFACESAALQMRKAMEAIAFASIAPNKEQYAAVQRGAEKSADYRNDWNARLIFKMLADINPDFYPKPMSRETKVGPNAWHYGKPLEGYMSQARFEKFYQRLGKFLHADNPWGSDTAWVNVAKEMTDAIRAIRALLVLHRTVIRSPNFNGVWVIGAPTDVPPFIYTAAAVGEFVDTN
jgi:hypothetical protein